jgi:hypothetical protein
VAGAVSLLVMAGVVFYSFNPAAGEPVLDPVRGVNMSPEYQRPRGGGPGASAVNRPAKPFFRSKISEMAAP